MEKINEAGAAPRWRCRPCWLGEHDRCAEPECECQQTETCGAPSDAGLRALTGVWPAAERPPEPPPVDNEHVAPGCERFSDEAIATAARSAEPRPSSLGPAPKDPK